MCNSLILARLLPQSPTPHQQYTPMLSENHIFCHFCLMDIYMYVPFWTIRFEIYQWSLKRYRSIAKHYSVISNRRRQIASCSKEILASGFFCKCVSGLSMKNENRTGEITPPYIKPMSELNNSDRVLMFLTHVLTSAYIDLRPIIWNISHLV